MNVIDVQPQTFRQYGDLSEGMAATVAAAGAADVAASTAVAVAVFGLIGQEFLTSYAVAQVNHFTALGELVGTYAEFAARSRQAALSFEQSEQHSAGTFTAPAATEQ